MSGIYIHIPFCRQKCHYCNFFSIPSVKNKDRFLAALFSETGMQNNYLSGEPVNTIYFGGGTPSMLSGAEISQVIVELAKYHIIDEHAEITLEANPDDLTLAKIKELKKTPVNRLSIGVQSFFDDDLKYLNRVHSASEALVSVKTAIETGFTNMSIDLIYGIPTLSDENWQRNLEIFFSLNIPHLSAYALTVEPKTTLDVLIARKKMQPVEEELTIRHFKQLMTAMREKKFVHYEISNFCREPFYSMHNRSYWSGKKYLGLGPSAHSYNGKSRQWNVSNLTAYNQAIESKTIPAEKEDLNTNQQYNEYILTSLRTIWGTDLDYIDENFGKEFSLRFQKIAEQYLHNRTLVNLAGRYILTDEGKLLADGIASELFF